MLCTLAAAALALAQPAPATGHAAAGGVESSDAGHRAEAGRLATLVWPAGALSKVMQGLDSFGSDTVFDMRVGDLGMTVPEGEEEFDPNLTLGEIAQSADPHVRERTRITEQVMMEEIGKVLFRLEPKFQEALADFYAARFSAEELRDSIIFFSTPAGRKFAEEQINLVGAPEYQQAMVGMMPQIMDAMPTIMERIEIETAHLPPAPEQSEAEDK